MTVATIMSKALVTVDVYDSLRKVKKIFDDSEFHHLLVVEEGRLFGVIEDRDLLKALSPSVGTVTETAGDQATLNKKAHLIMTRKPITVKAQARIYDAIEIFNQHHDLSCIPVVDDEYKPVGIISWRDILKTL